MPILMMWITGDGKDVEVVDCVVMVVVAVSGGGCPRQSSLHWPVLGNT